MPRNLLLRARVVPFALAGLIVVGGAGKSEVIVRSRTQAAAHMAQRLSVDLRGQTLGDAIAYLAGVAGLEAAPYWAETDGRAGLDPEALLNVQVRNATVEEAVERILASLPSEAGDEPTWQLGAGGVLEIGPRSRLNGHHRVETYPIADLVRETPDFRDVPKIDLSAALQPGSGGTIFSGDEGGPPWDAGEMAETPAERLARLITTLIEPEQWRESGGDGASIHIFRDALVIDAPEYIHRQIGDGVR